MKAPPTPTKTAEAKASTKPDGYAVMSIPNVRISPHVGAFTKIGAGMAKANVVHAVQTSACMSGFDAEREAKREGLIPRNCGQTPYAPDSIVLTNKRIVGPNGALVAPNVHNCIVYNSRIVGTLIEAFRKTGIPQMTEALKEAEAKGNFLGGFFKVSFSKGKNLSERDSILLGRDPRFPTGWSLLTNAEVKGDYLLLELEFVENRARTEALNDLQYKLGRLRGGKSEIELKPASRDDVSKLAEFLKQRLKTAA